MLSSTDYFTPQKKRKREDPFPFPAPTPVTATKARRQLFSLAPADLGTSLPSPSFPPSSPPAKRARKGDNDDRNEEEEFLSDRLPRTPKKVSPMLFLGLTPKPPPDALKRTLLRTRKSPVAFFKVEPSLAGTKTKARTSRHPEPTPKKMRMSVTQPLQLSSPSSSSAIPGFQSELHHKRSSTTATITRKTAETPTTGTASTTPFAMAQKEKQNRSINAESPRNT